MRLPRSFALCALVGLMVPPLEGQTVLTGRVVEEGGRGPLAGVQILIEGTRLQGITDSAGRFLIVGVPRGRGSALFRAIGFRPTRLLYTMTRDTLRTQAVMARSATELKPIVVNARPFAQWFGAEGFEERRRIGFGKFIDPAELRSLEMLRPSDVLRRTQAGIDLRTMGDQLGGHVWAASTRSQGPSDAPCWMQVVVDGAIVYRPGGRSLHPPPDLANDYNVSDLQAIEVYRSAAETPMEFGGEGADCGTLVLWTRRGWESGSGSPRSTSTAVGGRGRRIGLVGGVTLGTLGGSGAAAFGNRKPRTGLVGGVFFAIPIQRRLDFAPEFLFMMKGGRANDSTGTWTVKLNVLEMPLLLKAILPVKRSRLRPNLQVGPVATFRLSCETEVPTGGTSSTVKCDNLLLTESLGVGAMFGAGVELGPLSFAVRYDLGLSSLRQNPDLAPVRTRTFSIVSGIAISLGR